MMLLLSGCAGSKFADLTAREREASLIEKAIAAADTPRVPLPDQPSECPKPEASNVKSGDRLDIAVVKTDAALDRANAKAKACSDWYDSIQSSHNAQ
jgi:hypothetical protein